MSLNSLNELLKSISVSEPEDNAWTLRAECYTRADLCDFELSQILAKNWQYVGHISQLKNNGDLIVAEVANKPAIILKDHEGVIRAFYNVCKHRAGPLAYENGNVKTLSCKYHGWNYHLTGELRIAPEMSSTPNFKSCDVKLDSIEIDFWQGFIFAKLNSTELCLAELLNQVDKIIVPIDLSQFQYHHRDSYVIKANWKTYMDNYLEGYHLPHVHPGLSKLLDYKSYDTKLYPWFSYQFSPLDAATTDTKTNFYGDGMAHYFCVYPNMMLNILPNRCQVNLIEIIDKDHCRVIFDYYYTDLNSEATQKLIAEDLEFSDEIQQEDIAICEHVQKGLASGAYHKGRLCVQREMGVWHWQELIRKAYRTSEKL